MAYINRPKKKRQYSYEQKLKNDEVAKFYNSVWWRNTRKAMLMENPLCQECLKNNKVTEATQIHHKKPWQSGISPKEQEELFYDINNLVCLCSFCHKEIHKKLGLFGRHS